MAAWGMASAKAKLSEVVHEAETAGPQTLLRSGREVAVVLSLREYQRLKNVQCEPAGEESIAEFFQRSPLWQSGLELEPLDWQLKDLDL